MMIYGTAANAGDQSLTLSGDANVAAVAFMPNANASFSGNMGIYGAVVANSISVSGQADFHYDEALNAASGGSYKMVSWRELVGTEQIDFATYIPIECPDHLITAKCKST